MSKNSRKKLSLILLWILLALPGIMISVSYMIGKSTFDSMMHTTGEFGGRFLVITLIATPLSIIFPKTKLGDWLIRNRRYFGVAAFFYTFAHTVAYVLETTIGEVAKALFDIGMITGWLAFFIFIPLAITSTNSAVKKLGKKWKNLHRLVYLAAILTFAHWALIHNHWKPALVHFAPIIMLHIIAAFVLLYRRKKLV